MRVARSLTTTGLTLLVLAAAAVALLAFVLPKTSLGIPGLDTTGVEQRAQGLVQQVGDGGSALLEKGVAVVAGTVTGMVEGAAQGARDAAG